MIFLKTLIITEKPSAAISLASVLKCTATSKTDFYFSNLDYYIVPCFGHLFGLQDAVDYDPKFAEWKLDNFPFVPEKYEWKLSEDSGIKKQFELIKKLANSNDVDKIINACDYDREGDLIGFITIKSTKSTKPIYRMYLNTIEYVEVMNSLKNLETLKDRENIIQAGLARSEMDWALGINLTTVASLQLADKKTINLGRVIMPTIKFVYDRDKEIENFKTTKFYELFAITKVGNDVVEFKYFDDENKTQFNTLESLDFYKSISRNITIEQFEIKEVKKNPPKLFSLIELTKYMIKNHDNFDGDKVLKCVQHLYEEGLCSYPRTDTEYLKNTEIEKAKRYFDALSNGHPFSSQMAFSISKAVFDDEKCGSHTAIIPTSKNASGIKLTADQQLVYNTILNRFLMVFMSPALFNETKIVMSLDGHKFRLNGKILKSKGHLVLEPSFNEPEFPEITEDLFKSAVIMGFDVAEGETSPPKKLTEADLVGLMKSCGKNVDEADETAVLQGYMIGTSATWGSTIKKVIDVGYLTKKGKTFSISQTGRNLIELFPNKVLFDPHFTGTVSKMLNDIEHARITRAEFLKGIHSMVVKTVNDLKAMEKVDIVDYSQSSLGKCCVCNDGFVIETSKTYKCSNAECNFKIFKESKFFESYKNLNLNNSLVKKLIASDLELDLLGIMTINDKKIDAKLALKLEGDFWNFKLDRSCVEYEVVGKCHCGSDVVEKSALFICDSCGFKIYKSDLFFKSRSPENKPVLINKSMVKKLLKGSSVEVKGFLSKENKPYNAVVSMSVVSNAPKFKIESFL